MPVIDCSLRESLRIGREIRVHLTGRVDGVLYIFIDAIARHELGGVGGFHASAPSGIGRCAHVLALRDGDAFTIGVIGITVEAVHLQIVGADALRDVRLRIDIPTPLRIVRESPLRRPRRVQRLVG